MYTVGYMDMIALLKVIKVIKGYTTLFSVPFETGLMTHLSPLGG